MTAIGDNLNKLEVKFQTISELMAKKRKLYLHKRVKSVDGNNTSDNSAAITTSNNTTTTATSKQSSKTEENQTLTSQSLTSLTTETNSNSLTKCSFRNFCFTSIETSCDAQIQNERRTRYNYENNPELRICMKCNRLNESNDDDSMSNYNSIPPAEVYNNCSCNNNNNCLSSCRPTYQHHHHHHHNNVLKHKSAQESSASHNNNNTSHNQEIHMQNSYYLLRDLHEQNRTQTDNLKLKTSCASTTTTNLSAMPLSRATATMSASEIDAKLRTSNTHRTYLYTSNATCNNNSPTNMCSRRFSASRGGDCKKRFFLQLYNIVMILKTLLVLVTRTTPSLLRHCPPAIDKNHKHYRSRRHHQQNSLEQVKQRLTHFNDQQPQQHCHYIKQKSSLHHTANPSFTKWILMGLSFLSICLPLSQALTSDFETTLQSSLATLERSTRDVAAINELQLKPSSTQEQVRLTRPEHVCKSLDIRNSASQFHQLENCTVIEGFLLITLLNGNSLEDYTETFPLLTEITDFIIVYQVQFLRSIGRIFPNLSVIRGRVLFEGYALIVYSNSHLEELGLTNLTTISRGGVRIEKNVMLCFVKSIDWTQIVSNTTDIVIELNRDTIECPACPGDQWSVGDSNAGQNELACKEHHGRRHCWNSKSCQKICPRRCQNNCVDENTCCNEACIGGCSPNNLNECISCRNFSIYNTTCIDKCPDNFYKYLDRRCLTAESCNIIGTKYENNRQEVLVAYEGSCSTVCPEGYTKVNMTCVQCGDKCTKKCQGSLIDSVARAREFHGCTHIVQSPLMINIKRGGRHLMEDLAYGLSSIVTIETALKVQGTYGIFDLKFFRNLQKIEGEKLVEDKYAFYVLENTDIETIWNPNQTVQILKGTVYFHFNPKLCLSEINALLNHTMLKQKEFDKTEVSQDSNGSRGSCNTTILDVTVSKIGSLMAFVIIKNPMEYVDQRTFIGYQFLHIEDPHGNATKHAFRPCEDGWEISEPTKDTFYIYQNLKPYTRYSFYVKTSTISTERRNGQSPIQNFITKSDQPKSVNNLQAYANSSYNIVMTWLPPTTANGKLIKYKIRAIYDKRIQRIESRNYCKDPLKEISKPEIPVATITEKPTIPKNCNCKNAKVYDEEEIDASIHASIELENALQNFVYVKKVNKTRASSRNLNSNELLDANNNRNRRAIEGDPFDSFLLRHIRDVPVETNLIHDTTTPTTTTTTLTVDPHNDGTLLFNKTRMDPEGEYYEIVVDSVNASTTEYVFSNLKHFSWYLLSVEACREKDSLNDTLADCSIEQKKHIRTLKLDNVDKAYNVSAMIESTNSSRSNVRLTWKRPERPNGAVVSYTILYLLQSPDAVEEKRCITELDYVEMGYEQNGYVLTNLNPGNYSIRIITNTLAGEGQYSDTEFVYIPPVTLPTSVIVGIAVGTLSAVILIGIFIYYLCRKRILAPPSDLKIFPSVNPHYISLQYIPDEWEVARDKVILLNPLGRGSFGMVYEGILKGYNNSNDDTPCAVKTVTENATDRERMNFLNEACVMKQFDTFHVVRLLGVCSRGQPALVVMELMKNGDLKSYLRAHRIDVRDDMDMPISARSEVSAQPPPISRIYQMAIEIADGMAYLAAKKFVHRDLAARNCMVAADLTVKIGDFGMTRDIYENDYYRKGTKGLLPVRWMPPESLRDGVYSTSSDVFSYGVVLWEMATLASQPYQGLSNDQVLRYVIDGGVMERPENCPDKLYSLMQKCWHHRPTARPTFMEIIRYLLDLADPYFREVSFFHSEEGQQILVKEIAERSQRSGDVFDDHDNDMEDVTTPLRLGEYSGYKLNMDNNSSVEHRGDSSMVIDDDAPHSPYSLTGSPIVVSSTPDEHVRNNFNMSRIINSHNQMLNSAPSTSAELRKAGPGISYYPHPHTHPHHRNLYQPTRYAQQQHQARQQRSDDVDAYVAPDFELKDLMESKRDSDEQGYEMYDPSPNYSEKVPTNVHGDDDEDDLGVHSTAGQNLLGRSKARQRQPTIMPLSSSMPDEVIGQPASSSLHPSTASAASSNASSKTGTGKYPSLRAVADSLGNNVTAKFRSILFNTHKRSGSNASYKSTSSNPNSAAVGGGVGGSSNNLTKGGRGKSMSGQNLGTIESGGSGSAGSYCANPRFYTPNNAGNTSDNPNYKRLEGGSGDTLTNKPKMSSSSAFSMSSNPNYQVLDESLNTTGASTSTNNPAAAMNSSLLQTTDNPNYQLMQAPATQKMENISSYVMMNEPKAPEPSAISISNNPNYQLMGPPPPPSALTGTMSATVLPQSQPPPAASRAGAGGGGGVGVAGGVSLRDRFKKYSSSSSAHSTSSSHETDEEDDDVPTNKGMKSDRIPLSRRSSNDRSQKKKHPTNRSRSQSSSSSSRSSNTATTTSQQQPTKPTTSLIASSTLLTKENWLKQPTAQQQQHHHHTQPPPPPNGFVGRETS
ncbi:insulin-like receptor [Calliphora vicina]|uniref:insulin-like receptor n=1 Tax=Calliphora vicina TaxID=7373 RepID=UPI00325B1299